MPSGSADARGILVALVHVMRNRPQVVEELAEQVPALVARHHGGPEQQVAGRVDGVLQQQPSPVAQPHIAQPFVGRRAGAVVGVGRRREPPFVDAAAMPAERIEVVRVQLEAASGQHERAWDPGRLEAKDARAGGDSVLNRGAIDHA